MGAFQRAKIYKKKKKWNATKKKIETKRIVENGEDTVVFERIPSSCSLESYSSDTSAESAKEDVFATCFSDNVSKEDGGDEFGNTKVNKSISDRGHSQWSKLKFGRIGQLFASKNMAANQ